MSRVHETLILNIQTSSNVKMQLKIMILVFLFLFLTVKSHSQSQQYLTPKIDHVLIAVNNLDSAKLEYEKFTFTVIYGGSSTKALNALIFLRDDTVIELIGKDRLPFVYTVLNKLRFTKIFGMMKERITAFRNLPVGLFNYCLYTENLDSAYKYLKISGLKVAKPVAFSRLREDKIKTTWKLVGSVPYDLPFFINSYNPSRLSDTRYLTHKNMAMSVDTLIIETSTFEEYFKIYNVIYCQIPKVLLNNKFRTSIYKLADQYIVLQEGAPIRSVFTKRDQSAPVRFTAKCEKGSEIKINQVNSFITLTN